MPKMHLALEFHPPTYLPASRAEPIDPTRAAARENNLKRRASPPPRRQIEPSYSVRRPTPRLLLVPSAQICPSIIDHHHRFRNSLRSEARTSPTQILRNHRCILARIDGNGAGYGCGLFFRRAGCRGGGGRRGDGVCFLPAGAAAGGPRGGQGAQVPPPCVQPQAEVARPPLFQVS
jgi:hypothetical protein